nr:reverse transcriptase domain-containing protein [Tanacetum cinerariifolium]
MSHVYVLIQVLSNPGVPLRVTPIQFALLVDVDTKESVVELQADKKPGASGRVFAITEGQAANTSEHHATIDCHSYRVIFCDIHAPEYTYHGSLPGKSMQIISALQARTLLYHGCEGFLAVLVITALKEQLNKLKGKAVLTEAVSLNSIDPELLKVDVTPLVLKLRKNRTAHTDYIRHTQEEAATLREIVERVNLVSSASGSLSQDNTKNNRIWQTQKNAKKNKVKDHLRTVKTSLNKASVVDSKATSSVLNSVSNVNSDLKCASSNGCLFSDNHDTCVVDYINSVNASKKSKSVKTP